MARELLQAADTLDFSKYRPGDVICIAMAEIQRWGQAESTMLVASIANAASRAGLEWSLTRDDARNELRVSFSEPEQGDRR